MQACDCACISCISCIILYFRFWPLFPVFDENILYILYFREFWPKKNSSGIFPPDPNESSFNLFNCDSQILFLYLGQRNEQWVLRRKQMTGLTFNGMQLGCCWRIATRMWWISGVGKRPAKPSYVPGAWVLIHLQGKALTLWSNMQAPNATKSDTMMWWIRHLRE